MSGILPIQSPAKVWWPAAVCRTGIIHCATSQTDPKEDLVALDQLIEIARALRLHLTFISVAGIEVAARHLAYYRVKLECEQRLQSSGVAHTIVRATQFHEFVNTVFDALAFGPILLKPKMTLQPVDVKFAAQSIAESAIEQQAGAFTITGPEILTSTALIETCLGSRRRRMIHLPVPAGGPLRALQNIRPVFGISGGQAWSDWNAGRHTPPTQNRVFAP